MSYNRFKPWKRPGPGGQGPPFRPRGDSDRYSHFASKKPDPRFGGSYNRRPRESFNPTPASSARTSPTDSETGLANASLANQYEDASKPYSKFDPINNTPPHSTSELSSAREPKVSGTNIDTGENPIDAQFDRQMHHLEYIDLRPSVSLLEISKNYRVLYDPELDLALSKPERKAAHRKLRFQTESSVKPPSDPRAKMGVHHYLSKPNKQSKKMQFKHLPQPRFTYDKHSLGPAPLSQLVVWDLPATVNEAYFANFFSSYGGEVKDVKFINDPIHAVPLGIATFTFHGAIEKALRLAINMLKQLKRDGPKIDGAELKIALNDNDNRFLNTRIKVAEGKLRMERFRREKAEREIQELQKKKDEEREAKLSEKVGPELEDRLKPPKNNTTTKSKRHLRRIETGVFLPADLAKYVKDRPFLFISDKVIPTTKISSQEIKKVLMKYDWTRVLLDASGYFVVFNSIEECQRCFNNEDGAPFFEYRMFMDMCIPEKFDPAQVADRSNTTKAKGHDVVDEATNLLIKEFQTFLGKDIRERVIAPTILNLLNPANYPGLMSQLKEKQREEELEVQKRRQESKEAQALEKSSSALSFVTGRRKTEASSNTNRTSLALPSFTKKLGAAAKENTKKKSMLPMQHALNYADQDSEDSEDEDSSRSVTPAPLMKRDASTSATTEDEELPKKRHKLSKLRQTLLYDESSEEEEAEEEDEGVEEEAADDQMDIDEKPEEEFAGPNAKYLSTATKAPVMVYDDRELQAGELLDLEGFQDLLKDDEDMELAKRCLNDVQEAQINHPEYWAWKKRQMARAIVSMEESIGAFSEHLENDTGSFKSQGYRKIKEADKIEYLPHKRRIHKPLKTVQHDDEEGTPGSNTNNNNALQSSRVNRANNRRFAADISAQKQILSSESDILNLNALNKRKKPVSFARSAIHNWGLFANEPIAAKEMIIEYVGESIRQQVAEHREKSYLKTGIGSSYLFRIDENTVIDATKKGGIARFINHCCNPSCTAKIIKVDGKKRIVIYALRDIDANEELTYDYKFERETNDEERIRCLCGAPGCKGFLN